MVDRILQQRLQGQQGNAHRVGVHLYVPFHPKSLIEAQALDVYILLAKRKFFRQQHRLIGGVVQGGPKQFGEVLDYLLGQLGLNTDQAGNDVHAVEKKMGANSGLKCLNTGIQLCLFLATEPRLDIEVPERDTRHDRRNQKVPDHFALSGGLTDASVHHKSGNDAAHEGNDEDHAIADDHAHHHGPVDEPGTQVTKDSRGSQYKPLHIQRHQAEFTPVEFNQTRFKYCQNEYKQLCDQHKEQYSLRFTEIWQEKLVFCLGQGTSIATPRDYSLLLHINCYNHRPLLTGSIHSR